MRSGASLDLGLALLPGARELLAFHARELPQRDDLCGAFCGALALRAAGLTSVPAATGTGLTGGGGGDRDPRDDGEAAKPGAREPLDQDAVALAAGSVVGVYTDPAILPRGETGRRDYRLALPMVEDSAVSGTTAVGLARAIESLAAGSLAVVPLRGPWNAPALDGLFDAVASLERPVTLLANLATRYLWGSHPRAEELLGYLLDGDLDGPAPDWDVGHFACVFGRLAGPRGILYGVADTYPSLGAGGVHVQPRERLATAIERRDMPAGGVLAAVSAQDAPAVRAVAAALGLEEGLWDNGTVTAPSASEGAHTAVPAAPGVAVPGVPAAP